MGKLLEQPISTLFQGVSTQPDTIRLSGQVEDAVNADFSVVTGGFSKRSGTAHIAELTELAGVSNIAIEAFARDSAEQRLFVIQSGDIAIHDLLTGAAKTVNVADGTQFFARGADSTVSGPLAAKQIAFPSTETEIDLTISGVAGGLVVDVEGSDTGAFAGEETVLHTFSSDGSNTVTIKPYIRANVTTVGTGTFTLSGVFNDLTYLIASDPENDFAVLSVADFTFIVNKTVTVALDPATSGSLTGTVQEWSKLPTSPVLNDLYLITGRDTDDFTGLVVKWDGSVWIPDRDPNGQHAFDVTTMPYQLVRNADGTFTFQAASWNERVLGNDTIMPAPDFVGRKINDISYFRARLVTLSDEVVYTSQAGDVFNFWPEKQTQELDSDPIGRQSSVDHVALLNFAVPFRRSMFVTANDAQFDFNSGTSPVLTPKTADLENTTAYTVSEVAKPAPVGDALYVAGETENDAVIFEYLIEDDAIDSTPTIVSKHAEGFIPAKIIRITGDSTSGTAVFLSNADRSGLYVYRTFFDDDEKQQSAWGKWTLAGSSDSILAAKFVNEYLYLVIKRGSKVFLERMTPTAAFTDISGPFVITNTLESGATLKWPVRLDRLAIVNGGTYNASTDLTTFTTPYPHESNIVILSDDGETNPGARFTPTSFPTATTVTVSGDQSAADVIVGRPYTMTVELSTIYARQLGTTTTNTGRAITSGVLQLRRMGFDFTNTGYFRVEATPRGRSTQVSEFTGRIVSDPTNLIGQVPIVPEGTFRAATKGRSTDMTIKIISDEYVPVTISSAFWIGFFNEITRQG